MEFRRWSACKTGVMGTRVTFASTARGFDLFARGSLCSRPHVPPPDMPVWSSSLLFWSAAVVALAAQAMLVRSLLLGRSPGSVKTPWASLREAAWVLLPAVVLVLTLVASWRRVHRPEPNASSAPVAMLETR